MDNELVFFVGKMNSGGAERVISILSRNMADQGMHVTILTYYDEKYFYHIDERVKVASTIGATKSKNIFHNIKWIRQYFKENAQVVVSFLAPFNIIAIISTLRLSCPVIVADRNDPRYIPSNLLIRILRNLSYRFADGIVLQTRLNQSYFSKIVQKKSVVIPNPVDLGELAAYALNAQKEKLIVSVGRLLPQKNHVLLCRAFKIIHLRHPEYRLIIYGEGPYRAVLEQLITQMGLADIILLPGNREDMHNEIARAELFVLSSNYEGMSNALIEAMCLGLPVISTRVSGSEDLILDGVNGLLVDVGDEKTMVNAMEKILSNRCFALSIATAACEINNGLSVDKTVEKWLNFINLLIDHHVDR